MEQTSIGQDGYEHSEWLRSLEGYKEELGTLKDRLTEIGGQSISQEAAIALEQFENRFRVQRDNIDRLRHNIKEHRNVLRNIASEHAPGAGERYTELGEAFNAEERAVEELRSDFQRFSGAPR
jgi:hypothetical protein